MPKWKIAQAADLYDIDQLLGLVNRIQETLYYSCKKGGLGLTLDPHKPNRKSAQRRIVFEIEQHMEWAGLAPEEEGDEGK